MSEFNLSYREVIPDQTLPDVWREVTLNTGGTQSTLQDIKVAERAGGYCYKDFSKHHTRNRFIYWRINHDVLEIVEQSLDVNLSGNKIRYRFIDTPILDGITIYETFDNVIVLVPTVCSVHRLIFPHPDVLHRQDEGLGLHPDLSIASIFAEASVARARDPATFNVFSNPNTANSQLPHVATSLLSVDEEAVFLLGYPSGEILLVRQAPTGQSISIELKYEGFMPRFISGIAEKFRSKVSEGNVVVSMLLHTFGVETYGLTLNRDGNLRVWSCAKGQCIATTDIILEASDSNRHLIQGAQNHVLRKTIGSDDSDIFLVVFMSFSTECQFHVFKPALSSGQFKITRINTLYSPGKDLVDFNLSSNRIWSLWRSEDGETSIYSAALCGAGGSKGMHWVPVILEPVPDTNFSPDTDHQDPRQAYLQHIFYPARFPLHIISKALSIYKRSAVLSEVNVSPSVLKQRVCLAVENEIQNELKEAEVSDEDYLECAEWCWSRFYSCCVQYHVAGLRPLGLLLLPSVSGAVLLKKSMYSFLRPLDSLEHMLLCSNYTSVDQFLSDPLLSEDLEVADDVIKLMSVIVYLEQQLSDSFKIAFEKELAQLKSPDVVMSNLIMEILVEMDEQFTWTISQRMNSCRDIYQAMHKLLELIKIECPRDSHVYEPSGKSLVSLNHLFSSVLGVSFITECLHQQAITRFTVCRNLLVVQNILLERGEQEWNTLEAVRSVCSPEIVVFTQASYATLYLTELTALPFLPLESTTQRLAPLKLQPTFNLKINTMQTISLLELFVISVGGFEAHRLYSKLGFSNESLANWHTSLISYATLLNQLIWPISSSSVFAEWLLSSGQHIWLQQYVRLLNNWCEWNNCTRKFLLAASLLSTGEHNKAQDLFLKAAKGIYTDQFLADRILVTSDSQFESSGYVNYYLKVIELFELHGARDCAINVAKTALSIADKDDPHLATLHSIRFMHHLKLEHYDEAYNALITNPDIERKKDNLRDLVKTLLDNKQLDKLMSYPYSGLEELFVSIIFTRARATDTVDNIYYDFLYSYHIKRGTGFIRLAASVMYEQGFRLLQHNTVDALEKQVKCFLASVNALSLCDEKFAWVVRPVDPDEKEVKVVLPRLAGSTNEKSDVITFKKHVEVLGVEDIKKELELASARLRLARFDARILANYSTTPTELVGLLTSVGIFKYALSLSSSFNLSYNFIFDTLTKQCLYLSETEDPNAWNWLIENDLHDLSIVGNCPSVIAWSLLQVFVEEYEKENMSIIHKVVCHKLVNSNGFIPHWLLASYKKRNPAELLRVLFYSGRLEEAVTLAGEYIMAALGHGKEHFGFEHSLVPTSPSFCLPVNVLDGLIYELQLQNEAHSEKPFEKEHEYLKDLFIKYLETSGRISNEMCRMKLSNMP